MIVVLDNYDSFVGNVARYLVELGEEVTVLRNDALAVSDLGTLSADALVISPGPCGPGEAGISTDAVRMLSGHLPILGICLGHQCIGEAFGATTVRAREPMHGRSSPITHDRAGLFSGLPSPLRVGRYHSLAVEVADDQQQPRLRPHPRPLVQPQAGHPHDLVARNHHRPAVARLRPALGEPFQPFQRRFTVHRLPAATSPAQASAGHE